MRKYFVIVLELPGCEHIKHYTFQAEKYRDITSLNAFFFGWKKEYNRTDTRLYVLKRETEFYGDWKLQANTCVRYGMKPVVYPEIEDVGDIWTFYNTIGWNWKKKKYEK